MLPRWDSVAALYCLTKSMMLTPCGPSAVPTGGAGVAAPAGSCTLTTAASFFLLGGMVVGFLSVSRGSHPPYPPDQIFETWSNESSTGVSRPKIDTSTLSFWVTGLTSFTVAGSVANGPSITVTDSPTSYSGVGFLTVSGCLTPSAGAGASSAATSLSGSGDGLLDSPTKPVTPGVLRTTAHDSSVSSIRTRMYPGRTFSLTVCFLPLLTSVTWWMGTSIWKM